jgi:hypothetical protein
VATDPGEAHGALPDRWLLRATHGADEYNAFISANPPSSRAGGGTLLVMTTKVSPPPLAAGFAVIRIRDS